MSALRVNNFRTEPGTTPRNDLPERRDYVYQGNGSDVLTAHLSHARLTEIEAAEGFTPYVYGATKGTPSRARPEKVLAGIKAGITEADRRPAPAPVELPRQELRICPACDADLCDTCYGGPCLCPCIDLGPAGPVAVAQAEPEPSEPERCPACGYLVTAPGHQISCGDPDSQRINRLASCIGRRP